MAYTQQTNEALAAGFSLSEIREQAKREADEAIQAGFTADEVYEGIKTEYGFSLKDDPADLEAAQDFIEVATVDPVLAEKADMEVAQGNPRPVVDWKEAVLAGYQNSITGLAVRGELPNLVVPETGSVAQKVFAMAGQAIGDMPALVVGGAAGATTGPAAPITSPAAAMGLTEGLRTYMTDMYREGKATTWTEVVDRTLNTLSSAGKGAVIGAATGGAGKYTGKFFSEATPAMKTTAQLFSEITTMTTAGSLMEGKMPTAEDFMIASMSLGGMKAAGFYSNRLMGVFEVTGKTPEAVRINSIIEPTIREDVASINLEVPRAYRSSYRRVFTEGVNLNPESAPAGVWYSTSKNVAEAAAKKIEGASVQEYQVHRSVPMFHYTDARGARLFKEFLKTPEGKASMEKMDPEFFQEYPNFIEKYKSVSQERLIPTSRKMFENPTPEFIKWLSSDKLSPEAIETLAGATKGKKVRELTRNIEGIQMGSRMFIFDQKKVSAAKAAPKGEMPIDAAQAELRQNISLGEEKGTRTWSEIKDSTYQSLVDKFAPLNTGASPGKMTESRAMASALMGSPKMAMHWIEHSPFKFGSRENFGVPLDKIIKEAGDPRGLSEYLIAKRTMELSEQGVDTRINPEVAYSVGKNPENIAKYDAAAQKIYDYNNNLLDYMKDAGLISERQLRDIKAKNKKYVPLNEVVTEFEPSFGEDFAAPKAVIIDPLESVVRNTFSVIRMAESNAVKKQIAKDFGQAVEVSQRESPLSHDVSRKTQITVRENGRKRVYAVPEEIAETARQLDMDSALIYNGIMKGLTEVASWTRAGSITTPEFVVRNLFRDQFTAAISNPGYIYGLSALKGFTSVISKRTGGRLFPKMEQYYWDWAKNGGGNASLVALDRKFTQEMITEMAKVPARNLLKDPVKNYKEVISMINPLNLRKAPGIVKRALQSATEMTDEATRIGGFIEDVNRGISPFEAAVKSRDITQDSMRIGAATKGFNAITAFFNAQVQGLDKTYRMAKGDPIRFMSGVGAGIVLPSLLLSLVNNDIMYNSPDSDTAKALRNVPDWQRATCWIVPTPWAVLRIPKPQELAVIAAAPVEMFVDWVYENKDRSLLQKMWDDGFFDAVSDQIIPSVMPSAIAPVYESAANYSFFTGNPIIPSFMEDMFPQTQYKANTTEIAKSLSRVLNYLDPVAETAIGRRASSPLIMEHLVRGWTGQVGQYVLSALDTAAQEAGIIDKVERAAPTLADLPVVKSFVFRYPSVSAKAIEDFQTKAGQLENRLKSVNMLMKEGTGVAAAMAEELMNSGPMGQFTGVRSSLNNMSKAVRMIQFNEDMDADEKRQLVDQIYSEMIDVAEQGLLVIDEVNKAYKEMKNAGKQ